jgi:phosphatidate phosphatase APP1
MSDWKKRLQNVFEKAEDLSDAVRYRFRDFDDDLLITPYLGFGNSEKIQIRGRVMKDKDYRESKEDDSTWRNLKNMYRRFETDEVPNARVKAFFQDEEDEVKTDKEGYFNIELDIQTVDNKQLWHNIEFELLDPVPKGNKKTRATGKVLIPTNEAKFGVISDIDDTILKTNVNNKVKMILTTILSNAHTRVPFEGVATFYQALQKGSTGNENNPIFYVSSSPYNLYNLLVNFLKLQDIPLGPIFLKDFGSHTPFTSGDHQTHKLKSIKNVLETLPHLQFVLIGDNSEQDPEIYRRIVTEYPERIKTIYIRKVNDNFDKKNDTESLVREVQNSGSQLIFAPDSEYAAIHAAGENLISAKYLNEIQVNKELDKKSPEFDELGEDDLVN